MYCSNCGTKIIEGNSFCTNCGNKVVKESKPENISNQKIPQTTLQKTSKGNSIFFILIIIAVVIGGIYFFYQNLPQNKKDEIGNSLPVELISEDNKMERQLIGKWKSNSGDDISIINTIEFVDDGTCHYEQTPFASPNTTLLSADGTWKVKDRILIYKIDKAKNLYSSKIEIPTITGAEKIITITNEEMVTESDGKTGVYSRVSH